VRQPRRLQRFFRALSLGLPAVLAFLAGHAPEESAQTRGESPFRRMAEASALMDSARSLEAHQQAPAALASWQRAYDLSSDPSLLLEVARLERAAGNWARATHALEQFLEPGTGRRTSVRTQWASEQLRVLTASTARLTLETNVQDATVELERDRGVVSSAGYVASVLLDAGERSLVLTKPGYETHALAVHLLPGETRTLRVHLEKAVGGQSALPDRPRWAALRASPDTAARR